MPVANLNKEFHLHEYDPETKAILQALGEIYSNKNLGLNARILSASATLHTTDAIIYATSNITVTLPYANNWSSRDVGKSPVIVLIGVGGVITIATQSGDSLVGSTTVRNGEARILVSTGGTAWFTLSRFSSAETTNPTPTAASGTFTSVSSTLVTEIIGNRLAYTCAVVITTNGTAAGHIVVPMPIAAAELTPAYGMDNAATTSAMAAYVLNSNLIIKKYDGTYPGASGRSIFVSGNYRIA